jgi:GTPase SAR1 family protein
LAKEVKEPGLVFSSSFFFFSFFQDPFGERSCLKGLLEIKHRVWDIFRRGKAKRKRERERKKKEKENKGRASLVMNSVVPEYDRLFKITIVGGEGVGKTTLVKSYCGIPFEAEFRDFYIKKAQRFSDRQTILRLKTTFFCCYARHKREKEGVLSNVPRDVILLILNLLSAAWADDSEDAKEGLRVKLQIWDMYRNERFRSLSITRSSYRGAHCILVCCNLSDAESMQMVKGFMGEIDRYAYDYVVKIVVGLKSDLEKDEEARKILIDWCEEWELDYLEASAVNGIGVDQVFLRAMGLIEALHEKRNREEQKNIVLSPSQPKNKKCVIV